MREQAVHVVRLPGAAADAVPSALEIFDQTCPSAARQSVLVFRGRDEPLLLALFCEWDGQVAKQRALESEALQRAVATVKARLGLTLEWSATLSEVVSYGVQPRQARVTTAALLLARDGAGGAVRELATTFYRHSAGWPGSVALFFGADSSLHLFFLVQEWERRQGLEYYLAHPARLAYLDRLGSLLETAPVWFEHVPLWELRRPGGGGQGSASAG